jgi:hypothetical protein
MRIRTAKPTFGGTALLAYTLAEVAVTSALMGVLFVSLYGGMSSGFAITQVSRENLRATQILVERMEGIRLFNWYQLVYSNWVPSVFTNYYYPVTREDESPGIQYIGHMQVTRNPTLSPAASYSPDMCSVQVRVDWVSGNVPRTRTMTTYVARNGIQNYVYNSTNWIAVDPSTYVFP